MMTTNRGLRRLDLLIETLESECTLDLSTGLCHDHDLTDDDECALVTDLLSIRAEIEADS